MKIDLTPYEINLILNALADKPYKDVAALIAHIKGATKNESEDGMP